VIAQETLGLMAGTLTTASFLPQVWRIWHTRSARDLSWGMVAVFTMGTFLWLLYGLMVGSTSILVANAITFLLSLAICAMKLRFDKEDIGDPR
jgi:MtN3 and saliva related transmembrane protein